MTPERRPLERAAVSSRAAVAAGRLAAPFRDLTADEYDEWLEEQAEARWEHNARLDELDRHMREDA